MQLTALEPPLLARLSPEELADEARALATEWIETDGRGGYAASTPWMCPTRRYHGLLVVPPHDGARRHVLLARLEEVLVLGGETVSLSSVRVGGALQGGGHARLEGFELAPFPTARFALGELRVRREVLLCRHGPAVLLRYAIRGARPGARLVVRPWLACREADALTFQNAALDPSITIDERGFLARPYASLPAVAITVGAASHAVERAPQWLRGVTYDEDARRGFDSVEDHFAPASISIPLDAGGEIVLAAALERHTGDPRVLFAREARDRVARALRAGNAPLGRLVLAADDFLYRASGGRLGVQAGYPWFGEWGRDTFVSLPGLTLARGDVEACGEALCGALPFLRGGLLPNTFGRGPGDSGYDSADAALWFARAVGLYRRAGGSKERVLGELLPALLSIVESYRAGTELGVRVDAEGLLHAGSSARNATWMDAITSSGPVTPRAGCAVELAALWYALLAEIEALHELAGDAHARDEAARARARTGRAFLARFWLADQRMLADVWDGERADASVRPNMVIAAALEASPLARDQRAAIVERSERELLTPRGLRTLSPADPRYVGRYQGSPEERDRAYHQGTAWPWLAGFHVEAALRAAPDPRAAATKLRQVWDELVTELDRVGLNHVSEVFDGDAPHRPGGTFAQAWNTAELLRVHALLAEAAR